MKKFLSVLLAAVMLMGLLTACGGSDAAENETQDAAVQAQDEAEPAAEDSAEAQDEVEPAAEDSAEPESGDAALEDAEVS